MCLTRLPGAVTTMYIYSQYSLSNIILTFSVHICCMVSELLNPEVFCAMESITKSLFVVTMMNGNGGFSLSTGAVSAVVSSLPNSPAVSLKLDRTNYLIRRFFIHEPYAATLWSGRDNEFVSLSLFNVPMLHMKGINPDFGSI